MTPPLGHSLLSGFWLAQIADILIITLVVRKLLIGLVKTRALKITILVLLILFAGAILKELRFSTVGFLISKMGTFVLIAFVLVFQQEIREILGVFARALESLPFLGHHAWTEEDTIDTIIETCRYLRKRHLGGLFVLERAEAPTNLYKGGIKLDTRVDADLLAAFLLPPGPLHDGAVVLRNNRVVSAATVLPLSSKAGSRYRRGTRHRAALGISEQSDAIAVVVSEETGVFSIAHDGILETPLTSSILRRKLLKLTGHEKN